MTVRALVTGGGGFLGSALVSRLLRAGWAVRSFSRGSYPALRALGAETVSGDLCDAEAVKSAAAGCDLVFHAGAKVGLWGRYEDYYRANVTGTKNVLDACRKLRVSRLVFTGSPSVVFDGSDVEGIDESAPTPARFDSHYSRTKALAEEMVLCADDSRLSTVSLRPHLIWGPGDNHIVTRIVSQGRRGILKRIGPDSKLIDTTYIDDAVEAHWLAAQRLKPGSAVCGRAYFISSGDPRPVWDIVNGILAAAGVPPVTRIVSQRTAFAAAFFYESVYRLLGLRSEPRLTKFMVLQLSTAHWFDISAARRDLGFRPRITIEEGLLRLRESFRVGPLA